MSIIEKMRSRAKAKLKTIALPEPEDKRVVEAASIINNLGFAKALLLDKENINPFDKQRYAQEFYALRRHKGITLEQAGALLEDPLYYAAMMTREGKVDGFVAGASHTTPDVARAAIQCLGVNEAYGLACSCFIMCLPNCPYGEQGTFVFADCGIVPQPTSQQLAIIAIAAAEFAQRVLEFSPCIALLSYSTKGSARSSSVMAIREALQFVKQIKPDLIIDGELQVDAAIVPEVAQIKCPDSILKGKANVLIFPNLEAGNIGYKLVQRLAGGRAIGPLFLGLNKPCSDLSRGCSVEDVVDCVAVCAIRAQCSEGLCV